MIFFLENCCEDLNETTYVIIVRKLFRSVRVEAVIMVIIEVMNSNKCLFI